MARSSIAAVVVLLSGTVGLTSALIEPQSANNKLASIGKATVSTRRQALLWTAVSSATAFLVSPRDSASAFSNKISDKFDDRPKRKGPQPKDLGLATRTTLEGDEYLGLKQCGAAPNCFSSSMSIEEDPDRSIPAWTWPKDLGDDKQKAFDELKKVIEAYKPGQNGVDGGGFEIQTFDPVKGYLYVQFQALKNGYIDDVEFAVVNGLGDRTVQVRSSSRVGYLDFGVNAKRLNFIAIALRDKGWSAVGVDFDTHRGYALENQV
jgi:uncharacterized protein (DUF1499 family)